MDPVVVELLRRARAGDPVAAGEAARALQGTVLTMARRLVGDRTEAEDVAQEALLAAFVHLGELRDEAGLAGWLRALVRTAASRRSRRRRPDLLDPRDLERPAAPARDPLVAAEVRDAVRAAVRDLTPPNRAVVERHHLDGRSVAETAAELGVPEGTVKRRLHDARAKLRLRLGAGPDLAFDLGDAT